MIAVDSPLIDRLHLIDPRRTTFPVEPALAQSCGIHGIMFPRSINSLGPRGQDMASAPALPTAPPRGPCRSWGTNL